MPGPMGGPMRGRTKTKKPNTQNTQTTNNTINKIISYISILKLNINKSHGEIVTFLFSN